MAQPDSLLEIYLGAITGLVPAKMVQCLTQLSKIAAARVEFGHCGMLQGDVLTAVCLELGDYNSEDTQAHRENMF